MALITPDVPRKLEGDLTHVDVFVSYTDGYGTEQRSRVTCPFLVLRPVIRVADQTGRSIDVPLNAVTAIQVDDLDKRWEPAKGYQPYPVVVAHWRRSQWGELIRFQPE